MVFQYVLSLNCFHHESVSHLKSSSLSWETNQPHPVANLDRLLQGDESQVGVVGDWVKVGVEEDRGHWHSVTVPSHQTVSPHLSRALMESKRQNHQDGKQCWGELLQA